MQDFLILVHHDANAADAPYDPAAWDAYLERLEAGGHLAGGSSLGNGQTLKPGEPASSSNYLSGFLRLRANSMADAIALCQKNPDYRNGARVDIIPLVEDA